MQIADPLHQFTLQSILPAPLAEQIADSDIWNQTLSLSKGARYAIIAPSGRGKTTLAHLLYGLRKDYAGHLNYGKTKIGDDALMLLQHRRQDWSMVFQDLRLFPDLTAKENIQVHQEMSSKPLADALIMERAKLMGIADLLDKPASLLSYGQQQRVAILRAISRPFSWLILDEPFSHLDEENQAIAIAILEEERARNGAGIIVFCLNAPPAGMEIDEVLRL